MRSDTRRVLTEPFADRIEGKVVVIGDIHGDYQQARQLLDALCERDLLEDRWLVFLGDYVDVGPDSAKVIRLLLDLHEFFPRTTTFLCGNHDLNLAKALGLVDSPHRLYYWNRLPVRNAETMASYGATNGWDLLEKMPEPHKDFFGRLAWVVEHPDYLFVHAGFDPDEPLEGQIEQLRQRDTNLFKPKWLYDDRLGFVGNAHQTGKVVVAGHSIVPAVRTIDNKWLIDTGAGYGGALTALLLPEFEVVRANRSKPESPTPVALQLVKEDKAQ